VDTSCTDTSAVDATTLDSSWIDVHGDGGVMKKVIREGVGEVVLQGKSVSVHYEGRVDGQTQPFDSTRKRQVPRSFQLGPSAEDDTYSIIIGLHDAILTMREHEVALVRLQPEYAYGPLGLPQIVPPASMVVFEVELCAIVSEEEVNHTTVAACHHLEEASLSKNDGNMCFANGQHKFALKCYNLGLASLQKVKNPSPEEIELANQLQVALYCNAAAACIQMKKYEKVIFQTTEALKVDPTSVKAHFRRAQAHMARNDFDEAEADFRRALQLAQHDEPAAKEIRTKLLNLAQKRRQHNERISHVYAKMFSAEKEV